MIAKDLLQAGLTGTRRKFVKVTEIFNELQLSIQSGLDNFDKIHVSRQFHMALITEIQLQFNEIHENCIKMAAQLYLNTLRTVQKKVIPKIEFQQDFLGSQINPILQDIVPHEDIHIPIHNDGDSILQMQCVYCMKRVELEDIKILQCRHSDFHQHCRVKWLKQSKKACAFCEASNLQH